MALSEDAIAITAAGLTQAHYTMLGGQAKAGASDADLRKVVLKTYRAYRAELRNHEASAPSP